MEDWEFEEQLKTHFNYLWVLCNKFIQENLSMDNDDQFDYAELAITEVLQVTDSFLSPFFKQKKYEIHSSDVELIPDSKYYYYMTGRVSNQYVFNFLTEYKEQLPMLVI